MIGVKPNNIYYIYRMLSGIWIILIFTTIKWKKPPISMLQNSFFTFCSHVLLLGIFQKIFYAICVNLRVEIVIGYIFCSISIWIVTIVVSEIIKKHFSTLYLVLSGNRKGKQ